MKITRSLYNIMKNIKVMILGFSLIVVIAYLYLMYSNNEINRDIYKIIHVLV